jgi:hypothetical protein
VKETPISPSYKSASLYIYKIYSNAPITGTRHILNDSINKEHELNSFLEKPETTKST